MTILGFVTVVVCSAIAFFSVLTLIAILALLWIMFRKLRALEVSELSARNTSEDTNHRIKFLCEQLLFHIDEERNRYVCANGVFSWHVTYAIFDERLALLSTVFVQDTTHFVPALVAGVLKRKHETKSLVLLNWKQLTDAEFSQESKVRSGLDEDPALFN